MNDNKKSALILGASGLVGSKLLPLLLNSDHYDKVIAVVRLPLLINHNKLLEKKIDFDMPNWEEFFPVDHVYCCLGTTIKKLTSSHFLCSKPSLIPGKVLTPYPV